MFSASDSITKTPNNLSFRCRGPDKYTLKFSSLLRKNILAVFSFRPLTKNSSFLYEVPNFVVSVETARRQGMQQGHTLHREVAILLQHGLIHLLGADHDALRDGGRFRQWEELLRPALESAFPAGKQGLAGQ